LVKLHLLQLIFSRLGDDLHAPRDGDDMDESEDQNCGKNYDGTFRRLSAAFEAMEAEGKQASTNYLQSVSQIWAS